VKARLDASKELPSITIRAVCVYSRAFFIFLAWDIELRESASARDLSRELHCGWTLFITRFFPCPLAWRGRPHDRGSRTEFSRARVVTGPCNRVVRNVPSRDYVDSDAVIESCEVIAAAACRVRYSWADEGWDRGFSSPRDRGRMSAQTWIWGDGNRGIPCAREWDVNIFSAHILYITLELKCPISFKFLIFILQFKTWSFN